MKQTLLIASLILTFFYSYSQSDKGDTISLNGFYIAKTGNVPAAKLDIYTYLRFHKDGSIYLQTVTSNDPQSVFWMVWQI